MSFTNVLLSTKLSTPIVLGEYGVNFTSLLHHVLFLHLGTQELADQELPSLLAQTQGVFHASDLVFGVNMNGALIAKTISTVGVMRGEGDFHPTLFKPTSPKNKYKKIIVEGGPTKSRLNHHKGYKAPKVGFYINGDAQKISELLNYYVNNLGTYANLGFGQIDHFDITELESDNSIYLEQSDGTCLLNTRLPTDHCLVRQKEENIANLALKPPFYKNKPQACFVPARIKRTIMK